jgi:hypothetical protein
MSVLTNPVLLCSDDAKLDALYDAAADKSASDDDQPRPVSPVHI